MAGKAIYYNSEARVYHSHDFSFKELWHRYIQIGITHQNTRELSSFLKIHGAGGDYAISELMYIWKKQKTAIFKVVINSLVKYFAYSYGYYMSLLNKKIRY